MIRPAVFQFSRGPFHPQEEAQWVPLWQVWFDLQIFWLLEDSQEETPPDNRSSRVDLSKNTEKQNIENYSVKLLKFVFTVISHEN